ncbi:unnamed protein product [Rotaria magnacalcarata]|uniref:HEAT repeat-containing protein 5B n=2 Tax=Rotaria magnacalcarata TaxID=392030 RepID=A0A818YA84_9BILA|nr:unnamed protein product [Rotaria magnacalcarata]CAF3751970.1 unnamed protein product [Rotaria magnacalcarata]
MLELAQSLILNEEALNSLPENKRPVFIYEWLCFLNKVLVAAQKNDIRECQPRIVEQLMQQVQYGPGPPIRTLIGRNLATLFSVGDPFPLFNTVNRCNEVLKSKDETAKLATVVVIGALYERLGRLVGRSYEDTVQLLLKMLKNGDSQMRFEIMFTFEHIINGLGSAGNNIHREIFKLAKTYICDRAMPVRSAAAMCLIALINQNSFMYTSELEGNVTLGFRALDGSNYEVRCSVAKYLAALLAATQETNLNSNQNPMNKSNANVTNAKKVKAEDLLNYLAGGFLRGNIGFLKSNTTERLKGPTTVQREIRIGVTHTYVELALVLGTPWIEQNLSLFINHVLELAGNPRASTSHVDAVYSRKCITFILRSVIGSRLGEKAQFSAAKEYATIITRYTTPQIVPNNANSSLTSTNDLHASTGSSSLNSSTNSMVQSYASSSTNAFESSSSNIEFTQHILICALHELSLLVQGLGTSTSLLLQDSCNGLIDTLFLAILNPSHPVRLSAAWCLRSITTALPSLMTPLIDRCLDKMKTLAKQTTSYNTDAMSGFALALQALLGAVYRCPLGIPSQRAKTIFDFADDLLRTATTSIAGQQQSLIPRVILQRTHTAWHLLAACCTLGQQVIKKFVPRLVLLWRNVFPRSQSDFEQEKQRGDSFTWTLSFNQRSGALCSMISFLNNCSSGDDHLVTDDLLKRMLNPIENAILVLLHIPNLIKQFGSQLKASTAMFRLRLYELLLLVPIKFYEQHFKILLRELVAEFTLTDNSSNTTTSLLRSVCHDNDSVLLGNWLQETDYQLIEEQLQPNSASGSGALEHDETFLYRRDTSLASFNIINYLFRSSSATDNNSSNAYYSRPAELNIPGPLPLGVAVIDSSILLYGTMFIRVPNKHRLNMLQHFIDIIKQSKGARQEAVQVNIFTAVLTALKTLAETKQSSSIDDENVKKCACTLVMQTLSHQNPILRCAAGEALGRLTQVVGDGRFVADIAQICFDRLKEFRDIPSRTGYSLALGCLHRYVGGMSTGQYLNLSISILLALAQDQSASIVQVWALHALALIADCGGQMFRSYVEPSLALILHLLLSVSPSQSDVFQCCGRLLGALIITIGPELQTNTNYISILRSSCLTASSLLQMHIEPIVQSEAIQALQQLHLFAPRHVNLSNLVPDLIKGLKCRDLSLRRACVSCLRQLSQREAKEVSEHAKLFIKDRAQDSTLGLSEFRCLEELLFSMLDTETDAKLCSNVQDTLVYMLQALGANNLSSWLQLCKDVLAATTETTGLGGHADVDQQQQLQQTSGATATSSSHSKNSSRLTADDDEDSCGLHDDDDDDYADTGGDEQLQTSNNQNSIRRATSSAKWPTKVFAADCVQKLITFCEQTSLANLHFDHISAKERLRTYPNEDYLVTHLNTLITFSFMSCTSTSDQLRLSGLSLLKQIIVKFAHIQEDIDLPGHVILEQYQAQVGAALRPAFSQDTSSHVTAQACDVCSTWISSGVAHDLNDLRRVHQLLVSSLQKFTSIQQHKNDTSMIYSENALTIENLAVLRAWADVYNVATIRQNEEKNSPNSNLLILVQPELNVLIHHWLAALTDYAFLILPHEFGGSMDDNAIGGNFYSAESNLDLTRTIYKANWSSVMQATTQWLGEHHYELETLAANQKLIGYRQRDVLMTKFITSTFSNKIRTFPEKKEDIFAMLLGCCVEALSISVSDQTEENIEAMLSSLTNLIQSDIATLQITMVVCIEILNVLQRLQFVRTDLKTHIRILRIVDKIFHIVPSCSQLITIINEDHLVPGESFLFASLELLVCVLLSYYPNIAGDLQLGPIFQMKSSVKTNSDNQKMNEMMLLNVKLLSELIALSSTNDSLQALIPVVLQLLLSTSFVILSTKTDDQKQLLSTIIQFIENIFSTTIEKDILRCTVMTIINFRTNLTNKGVTDNGHFVQCLTSLLINSPAMNLTDQCVDFYQQAFNDEKSETRIRALQCLNQLFQCTNTALRNQFIQIFAPLLLNELKKDNAEQQQESIIEVLKCFETLLTVVDSTLRVRLASLIIPLFINFLPDSTVSSVKINSPNARLISYIIERIQYLIPLYSNEFRLVLQTLPDLRTKLENAIRRQQQLKQQQKDERESNYSSKHYHTTLNSPSQAPSLPLRIDFSNFKSS